MLAPVIQKVLFPLSSLSAVQPKRTRTEWPSTREGKVELSSMPNSSGPRPAASSSSIAILTSWSLLRWEFMIVVFFFVPLGNFVFLLLKGTVEDESDQEK